MESANPQSISDIFVEFKKILTDNFPTKLDIGSQQEKIKRFQELRDILRGNRTVLISNPEQLKSEIESLLSSLPSHLKGQVSSLLFEILPKGSIIHNEGNRQIADIIVNKPISEPVRDFMDEHRDRVNDMADSTNHPNMLKLVIPIVLIGGYLTYKLYKYFKCNIDRKFKKKYGFSLSDIPILLHLYYNSWANPETSNDAYNNNYKLYVEDMYNLYVESYNFLASRPTLDRKLFLNDVKNKTVRNEYIEASDKSIKPINLRFSTVDKVISELYSNLVSKSKFKMLLKL